MEYTNNVTAFLACLMVNTTWENSPLHHLCLGPSLELLPTVDTTIQINTKEGTFRECSTHLKPSQKVKFHLSKIHVKTCNSCSDIIITNDLHTDDALVIQTNSFHSGIPKKTTSTYENMKFTYLVYFFVTSVMIDKVFAIAI